MPSALPHNRALGEKEPIGVGSALFLFDKKTKYVIIIKLGRNTTVEWADGLGGSKPKTS